MCSPPCVVENLACCATEKLRERRHHSGALLRQDRSLGSSQAPRLERGLRLLRGSRLRRRTRSLRRACDLRRELFLGQKLDGAQRILDRFRLLERLVEGG